jgi:hypothetical protein
MHGPMNVKSPNNASKWQMGFNSAFKGLRVRFRFLARSSGLFLYIDYLEYQSFSFKDKAIVKCIDVSVMLNIFLVTHSAWLVTDRQYGFT